MAARTKVMITTVGPYQLRCAIGCRLWRGTDYVDLSGEPGWMYEMMCHDAAAKASARALCIVAALIPFL